MTDQGAQQDPRGETFLEETQRLERRRLFEEVMAASDRGAITRKMAIDILSLSDADLLTEQDPGQAALFDLDDPGPTD